MKYTVIYIVALLCLSCSSLWAQSDTTVQIGADSSLNITPNEFPYYKDGTFEEYIGKNYILSKQLVKNGRPGSLFIRFIVEIDGTVSNVVVLQGKGLSPLQDKEAIRVIKSSSGKWEPGKVNGTPVRTTCKQQLTFDPDQFPEKEPDNQEVQDPFNSRPWTVTPK